MKLRFKKYFIFIAVFLILLSVIIHGNNSVTRNLKLYQLRDEINRFENTRMHYHLTTLYLNQNYIKYTVAEQSNETNSEEINKSINNNIISSINAFSTLMSNNKEYNEKMIDNIISSKLYEIQKSNHLLNLLELNIEDYNKEFEKLASRWAKNKESLKILEKEYSFYNIIFIFLQSLAIIVLSVGNALKD